MIKILKINNKKNSITLKIQSVMNTLSNLNLFFLNNKKLGNF